MRRLPQPFSPTYRAMPDICEATLQHLPTQHKTAYLVRHYPAQFYAAILSNQPMGYYPPATIVVEARRRGVAILPVDVNVSGKKFTAERTGAGWAIRTSLIRVKGMTEEAADSIVGARRSRRFTSLQDFCLRTQVNYDIVENLVLCGAFDELHGNRRQLAWDLPRVFEQCRKWKEEFGANISSDGSLNDLLGSCSQVPLKTAADQIQDFSDVDKFRLEFSVLHMNTGPHFMEFYRPFLRSKRILSTREAATMQEGMLVRVAGVVIRPHRPPTRSGRTVVFLSLEDEFGLIDVTIFENVYQKYGAIIFGEPALVVSGKIQRRGKGVSIVANAVGALPPLKR